MMYYMFLLWIWTEFCTIAYGIHRIHFLKDFLKILEHLLQNFTNVENIDITYLEDNRQSKISAFQNEHF